MNLEKQRAVRKELRTKLEELCTQNEALTYVPLFDELCESYLSEHNEIVALRSENKRLRETRRLTPNEALARPAREAALLYEVGVMHDRHYELRAALEELRATFDEAEHEAGSTAYSATKHDALRTSRIALLTKCFELSA